MIKSYLDDQKRSPVLVERQGHDEIYSLVSCIKVVVWGRFLSEGVFAQKRKKNSNKSLTHVTFVYTFKKTRVEKEREEREKNKPRRGGEDILSRWRRSAAVLLRFCGM